MNLNQTSRTAGLALLSGLGLIAAAGQGLAQDDYIIGRFDADTDASQWSRWWGSAPQTYEWDATVDAANDPASGSLKVTVDFDLAAYAGDNQFAAQGNFPNGEVLDGTKYTKLDFDIRFDPSSPQNTDGNFGNLEYGLGPSDWSQIGLGSLAVPTTPANEWIHVSAPIDPATAKLDAIARVWLKIWSGAAGGLTGTTTFWVDNVKLIANTNVVTPPPTMMLQPAIPGLLVAASAAGQQNQRQNVRTLATDPDGYPNSYSWVDASAPVTYSMTIKNFPDAAHSGFQAHLFLVPENVMPYGANDNSIDWNAANVVFLQIANNADGTATAAFMYKTNLPSGNAMFWNTDPANGAVGRLATVSDASAVGTWSLSFKNNTDFTLTAPSGASTNSALPADAALLFADPLYAYFGIQPNQTGNIGQAAVFSRLQISGTLNPIEDTFTGDVLDTTKWAVVAADAGGVVQVPATTAYSLQWTAPASGFELRTSPVLQAGSWTDPGLTNVFQMGTQKVVLVPQSALPSASQGFFQLVKP